MFMEYEPDNWGLQENLPECLNTVPKQPPWLEKSAQKDKNFPCLLYLLFISRTGDQYRVLLIS